MNNEAFLERLTDEQLNERKCALDKELALVHQELHRRKAECQSREDQEVLSRREVVRYSRQLILESIGVGGQLRLRRGRVLVVGGGGLGCPAALFLAAAGVGTIGVADYDMVEESNLHRQVLHTEGRVGVNKAESIRTAIKGFNSLVNVHVHPVAVDSSNVMDLAANYDVVLDASDNVATRYLLNDACVLADKPLVSGSALRCEGQLTVYNYQGGPTYRCLFPDPPPPETVTNCSDGGVLGVVPGVIGSLQALETIKILIGSGQVLSGRMVLFDAMSAKPFQIIQLRKRRDEEVQKVQSLIDYVQFCGASATDKDQGVELLDPEKDRMTARQLRDILDSTAEASKLVVVDVRSKVQVAICALPCEFLSVPIDEVRSAVGLQRIKDEIQAREANRVIVVCRRGNDSQRAVVLLREELTSERVVIKDVIGGLHSWADTVNKDFPVY